jgi:cytochrome c-type biogenesis protein CcmE
MSRLDEELAQAVKDAEASAQPAPVAPEPPRAKSQKRRNLGLLLALLAMGAGILALVLTSFDEAAVYSRTVDQLLRDKDKLKGRSVRVEGTLVKGTLVRRDSPCEYRFQIAKGGQTLPVRFAQCVVPDTFRDVPTMEVAVTAEGTLDPAGHFQAATLMAKCPSKYEMQERAKKGERAPHADLPANADVKL